MQRPSKTAQRFVKAVISGAEPRPCAGGVEAAGVLLAAAELHDLAAAGVLTDEGRPTPEARTWLKRQMIDEDAFAAQHRTEVTTAAGLRLNLEESPLARLASGDTPFLEPHQVEAGERVRRLWEKAQLQPRVTMSYSATHTASKGGPGRAAELTDLAMEARRQLSRLHDVLPADCAGVVVDVCGLLKGLQQVESERGWPRRSAKLVLRIGLEQSAQHFGLGRAAVGVESRRPRVWGERPNVVG